MLALERMGAVSHLSQFASEFGETYEPRTEYQDIYAELLAKQKDLYRRLFELA